MLLFLVLVFVVDVNNDEKIEEEDVIMFGKIEDADADAAAADAAACPDDLDLDMSGIDDDDEDMSGNWINNVVIFLLISFWNS